MPPQTLSPRRGRFSPSLFPVNGGCGAGLHPQQVSDWPTAALVKVQSCDQLDVSDP